MILNKRRQLGGLLLAALFLWPAADGFARKKDRRSHNDTPAGYVVEPDAMVAKAVQERSLVTVEPFVSRTPGRINTRFREGIDVSHYQGEIDWDEVVSGTNISYAYLKATEGASYVDDTYERNLSEARRVGLSVGSYHFYRASVTPKEQFDNMVRNIKTDSQDLVPIIDIEHRGTVSEAQFIRDLKELVRLVEQYYGKKPLLYSYQNFYNRHLVGHFDGYHWMIAKYQSEAPILSDGRDYIMWQYTSKGRISGIRGHVDRSRLMGNFKLLQLAL